MRAEPLLPKHLVKQPEWKRRELFLAQTRIVRLRRQLAGPRAAPQHNRPIRPQIRFEELLHAVAVGPRVVVARRKDDTWPAALAVIVCVPLV